MKKILHFLITFFSVSILSISTSDLYAQCTGGAAGATIVPGAAWSSVNTAPANGGTYYPFAATAGNIYYFSFCPADGGNSIWDTQITILNNAGTPQAGGYSDDYCGLLSFVAWTCPATATYRCLVNRFLCVNQAAIGTMVYRATVPPTCPAGLGTGVTNVASLPYSAGAGTTCGMVNDLDATNTTPCGSNLYLGGEDKVWIFTPATTGDVTITLTSAGTWTGLMLYNGCPFNGGGACVGSNVSATGNKTLTVCVQGGVTYYLILDSYPAPACNAYSQLTISAPVAVGGCPLGTGYVAIGALPYNSAGRTTCGQGDDVTAANTVTCGSNLYLGGEDEVFSFTPATTGDITISITSTGSYTGIMLYSGCPITTSCSGVPGVCVAYEQSFTGSKSLCYTVTAGITYYVIIDSWPAPACNPYNITITAPSPAAGGSICSNAIMIASLPFGLSNESTACLGNDYSNASTGSCGTLYESGEDKVYRYDATAAGCIGITLTGAGTNSIGYQVYLGCPGAAGTVCIGSNGGASAGTLSGSINLPSAGTYYIVIDTWSPPLNVTYNISIANFGGGPINDRPCTASFLPLGIYLSGNNTCSGNADEPAAPGACTGWGTLNTVWYRFTAPASGCVKVKTALGSMTNTMIAVYTSGAVPVACGSGNTLTYVNCNDNAPACGFNSYQNSELTLSGLTNGNTYYVMVDGGFNETGSFSIYAIDGGAGCATPFPPTPAQDCQLPNPVCQQTIGVPDPGYQAVGNTCDFGAPAPCTGGTAGCGPCATSCLCSGERGSVWYQIRINAAGFLQFDIVPNDWPGAPSTFSTDYDFALYGPNPSCSNLVSPIRCHYSALGVTGIYSATDGNAPPAYPGFGGAYRSGINVSAGQVYLLNISNFTNSTSGFILDFSNTAAGVINYTPPPGGTVIWTGNVNTDWFNVNNWGGCTIPTCDLNASIPGFPVNQPVINAAGAVCRNLDITPGANVTINGTFQLQVCLDFTNNGTLTANANSTVLFQNSINNNINQNINGSNTGANRFWNVVASKPVGYSVIANQDIDMGGNFTVTGAAFGGNFSTANRYHKVAGNVVIDVTAPNIASYTTTNSSLEFNGTAQTYLNQGLLNNIIMNQTGAGTLTLLTHGGAMAWMQSAASGMLTLTNGKIITGANRVDIFNRNAGAVTPGNVGSYVEGNLRRYMSQTGGTGVYDFPVGTSLRGYERISFNITTALANTVNYWHVNFNNATPATNLAMGTECSVNYHTAGLMALDHGYWQITSSPSTIGSGILNVTNYNRNWSTALGAGWTVMYNKTLSNVAANWQLNPFPSSPCLGTPVTATARNNISVPALFSGIPVWFGTAQSVTPLPVELIRFEAKPYVKSIGTIWATASETNNKGFDLERSIDGIDFTKIAWIEGHGNTSQLNNYSYEDMHVTPGVRYYYRLKQIDYNGSFVYSMTVSAQLPKGKNSLYTLMPNPYGQNTTLSIFLDNVSDVSVKITDILGRHVATLAQGIYSAGTHSFDFSAKSFGYSSGTYTMLIKIDGQTFNELLIETE